MGDYLIVKSAVKASAKTSEGKQCNVGGDLADKINEEVTQLIKKACDRAAGNGRSTVMAKDF
jgi:histone H3/H4